MVHNVMEFCQSQLEWMSDSLSRSFYNGKPNPFDLPLLKVCTSVREMEKLYSGPKVVIATDSSLNCGCGKELLLKWGGDPRYHSAIIHSRGYIVIASIMIYVIFFFIVN